MGPDSSGELKTVLGIRGWEDLRRFLHTTAPAAASLLLTISMFSSQTSQLITAISALIVAVTDSSVAMIGTAEGVRQWIYPVLTALGSICVIAGLATEHQWAIFVASVPIFLGGTVRMSSMGLSTRAATATSETGISESDDRTPRISFENEE